MVQADNQTAVALVVEHDEDQRVFAVSTLETAGYRVIGCANAEDAISELGDLDERLAFVFAEIRLPGAIDGVALARLVRERYPWVTVMLTSGSGPTEQLPAEIAFVMKPWNAVNLLIDAEIAKMN